MTDPTPASTALVRATERYSALARVWHDSRPTHTLPFERCVWSECQIERHDALIAALAAAEAPGRVAARDALVALHDFLWDEMEWFSDESAPMPRYTTMAHGQKHDDLVERFHDAYPELLAAAEAPGRVAALEAALRALVDMSDGLMVLTGYRDEWRNVETLIAAALAAPAPTPSEPVARCGFTTDGFRCNDTPLQHRYLCGLLHSHTFVCHPFTSGARDE